MRINAGLWRQRATARLAALFIGVVVLSFAPTLAPAGSAAVTAGRTCGTIPAPTGGRLSAQILDGNPSCASVLSILTWFLGDPHSQSHDGWTCFDSHGDALVMGQVVHCSRDGGRVLVAAYESNLPMHVSLSPRYPACSPYFSAMDCGVFTATVSGPGLSATGPRVDAKWTVTGGPFSGQSGHGGDALVCGVGNNCPEGPGICWTGDCTGDYGTDNVDKTYDLVGDKCLAHKSSLWLPNYYSTGSGTLGSPTPAYAFPAGGPCPFGRHDVTLTVSAPGYASASATATVTFVPAKFAAVLVDGQAKPPDYNVEASSVPEAVNGGLSLELSFTDPYGNPLYNVTSGLDVLSSSGGGGIGYRAGASSYFPDLAYLPEISPGESATVWAYGMSDVGDTKNGFPKGTGVNTLFHVKFTEVPAIMMCPNGGAAPAGQCSVTDWKKIVEVIAEGADAGHVLTTCVEATLPAEIETGGTSGGGCVAAAATFVAVAAVAEVVKISLLHDPPDAAYTWIPLPRPLTAPLLQPTHCRRLNARSCAALSAALARAGSATARGLSAAETLAVAADRLAGAVRDNAYGSMGLQTATMRATAGLAANAFDAASAADRALAALLRRNHLAPTIRVADERALVRTLTSPRTLASLVGRFVGEGLATSRAQLSQMLRSALRKQTLKPVKFTTVLNAAPKTSGLRRIYDTMTVADLARLIMGLNHQGSLRRGALSSVEARFVALANLCSPRNRKRVLRSFENTVRAASRATGAAELLDSAAEALPALAQPRPCRFPRGRG
jgi:hypothetical protein